MNYLLLQHTILLFFPLFQHFKSPFYNLFQLSTDFSIITKAPRKNFSGLECNYNSDSLHLIFFPELISLISTSVPLTEADEMLTGCKHLRLRFRKGVKCIGYERKGPASAVEAGPFMSGVESVVR